VVGAFDGGKITSDAGALLLTATDGAVGLIDRFAGCFSDSRSPELVEHTVATLVGQRIFGIALGYQDVLDHDGLRHDPMMRPTRVRRGRSSSISMPPTTHCTGTRRTASSTAITIATATCPFTSSATGTPWRPNCAVHIDASAGAVEEVARIAPHIRSRWPRVPILLRADAVFAREQLIHWCELNGVDFLFGLAKNVRRMATIAGELAAARQHSEQTGWPARRFKDFTWSTLQ
jgi:hypothetical protein